MLTTYPLLRGSILFLIISAFLPNFSCAQLCSSGSIYVSGTNCGCWQNCDLSAYNGPSCNSGVLGNCDAGHQLVSTKMYVPSGCSVTASISMANRNGCPHSAADGGPSPCTSCDRIRVYSTSNTTKAFKSGSDNSAVHDSELVTGPDSVIIEGYANRQDEIISYSISYYSGSCDGSCVILPLTLLDFHVQANGGSIDVFWTTAFENNLSHFELSGSKNGNDFFPLQTRSAASNDLSLQSYSESLSNLENWSYIQLTAYDLNFQLCFVQTSSKISAFTTTSLRLSPSYSGWLVLSSLPFSDLYIYSLGGQLVEHLYWTKAGATLPRHLEGDFVLLAKGGGYQEQLRVHLGP